jgi:hypothetical protein
MKKKSIFWIYGTCNNLAARKSRFGQRVQMLLHKAGNAGCKKDYWTDFDSSHWGKFMKAKTGKL